MSVEATESLRKDLASLVSGGRASTNSADRVAYGRDMWPRAQILTHAGVAAPTPPAVVVWPENPEEVAGVVSYAAARGIPLTPFGGGSGVCGGIRPTADTIMLDMKRMRRLTRVDEGMLSATAGAGMLGQHLEDELAERGFTLGHFPSSIYCSTLGGWIAARSAGQCSGRYGKIEDMVEGLTCVDGRGQILRAEVGKESGTLLPLIIGSEGVLAIVTDADLRIAPAPGTRRFSSYSFPSTEAGLEFTRRIYQLGLRPAVCRLYDPFDSLIARTGSIGRGKRERTEEGYRPGLGARMLRSVLRRPAAVNGLLRAVPDGILGGATLVLMWEDAPEIADAERAEAHRIATMAGARDLGEDPARRWLSHRHDVAYRQSPMYASGNFVDTMEVAASWSRLLPMYEAVRRALSPHVFVMAHFSHAYPDGASIYFTFAGAAKSDDDALAAYDRTWRDALAAVVDAGGTFSHHHGVGRSKASAMRREQGAAIDVMRELKRVMDPAGILNPGALIPGSDRPAQRGDIHAP